MKTELESRYSYYDMRNAENNLQGISPFGLFDADGIETLDKNSIWFWSRYFHAGRPLKLKGECRLTQLPPDFKLSLFQFEGIIAAKPVADALERLAPGDIQRFPMDAAGDHDRFEMINLTKSINYLDLEKSDICFHPIQHEVPMGIRRMVLKRRPIGKCQIFRLSNHLTTAVCSANLRDRLTAEVDTSGTQFIGVETVD